MESNNLKNYREFKDECMKKDPSGRYFKWMLIRIVKDYIEYGGINTIIEDYDLKPSAIYYIKNKAIQEDLVPESAIRTMQRISEYNISTYSESAHSKAQNSYDEKRHKRKLFIISKLNGMTEEQKKQIIKRFLKKFENYIIIDADLLRDFILDEKIGYGQFSAIIKAAKINNWLTENEAKILKRLLGK